MTTACAVALQGKVLMIRFYEGPTAQDSRM